MAGKLRNRQRLPLAWQSIQQRDTQPRFDSREQLLEPNNLEAVQACDWLQSSCESKLPHKS